MKQGIRRAAVGALAAVTAVGLMATPAWAGKSKRDFDLKDGKGKLLAKVHVEWTYNVGRVMYGVQRYNGSFDGTITNKVSKTRDVAVYLLAETGHHNGPITPTPKGDFRGSYVDLQGAYFQVCSFPKGSVWSRDKVCVDTR
ncbi:hypothetical protein GCM10022247_71950 [Allokutzneria multivorans]|uniref:DUF2147 domain-containing protein n=1 Tax=Allokutzneria multivorans TaxID=1142134 RepID=A0ABP7U4C2_9PSEU